MPIRRWQVCWPKNREEGFALDKLGTEELVELQEEILARLPEEITAVLIKLNANGRLEEFLHLIGMGDLAEGNEPLETWPEGKIMVFGDAKARPKDLYGVAKTLGISRDRIVFIDHDESVRYDFRNLEYNHSVVAVMFGAVPHSTRGRGSDSSIISRMERMRDVYPRTIRLTANGALKVTTTNFRENLVSLIDAGLLAA